MIENFFCKIGTLLKTKFSWKRAHSDNQKSFASAKGNGTKAGSMSGNHNSQQIADTIYNLDKPNINALENSESWEKLIACFSEESAQRVAKNITDPRMQKHMKTHNGPGEIKWLKGKFKNVPMYEEDPRANTFVAIQTKALADLDSFINTKDEEAFLKAWTSHREALLSISTKDK